MRWSSILHDGIPSMFAFHASLAFKSPIISSWNTLIDFISIFATPPPIRYFIAILGRI